MSLSLGGLDSINEVQTAGNVHCAAQYFRLPVQLGQAPESASDQPQTSQVDKLTELRNKISSLIGLQHENLVEIFDVKVLPQEFSVVMFSELISGGLSLEQLIQRRQGEGGMREDEIRLYTTQICRALEYLETNRVVHRELDSATVIVVQERNLVKLMNYGISVKLMEGVSTNVTNTQRGRPYYMAPETLQPDSDEKRYSFQSDIWALGCLVYEMATGKKPYETTCRRMAEIAKKITKDGAPELPEDSCSGALKSFYYDCTSRNRYERPSAARLLEHPFLAQAFRNN